VDRNSPHLPHPAVIESYRGGGFRFGGMSHRGAILVVPDGMWASPVRSAQDIDAGALDLVFATAPPVQMCLIGAGVDPWPVPAALRAQARERGISIEAMGTGAAVRTYNILLEEQRRFAALLIPLD
jgi:uncharacterized protein